MSSRFTEKGAGPPHASRAAQLLARLGGPLGALLAVSLIAGLSFIALADEVRDKGGPLDIDLTVQGWAQGQRTGALDAFFSLLTWAGSVIVLIPLCLAIVVYLWRREDRHVIAPVVLAPLFSVAMVELLKSIFRRTRPTSDIAVALGYSFPSGHTTAGTAVFLTLAYVCVREGVAPRYAPVAGALMAILIGASRVYLNVHWASDVAGGWAVGSLLAAICAVLYERARKAEHEVPA